MAGKGVVAFAVLLLLGLVAGSSIEHVRLWDVFQTANGNTNFLYRGGNPDLGATYTFDYDQLVSQMQSIAKDEGYDFPSTFYMYDISFLNDYSEPQPVKNNHEFEYFRDSPQKGEWVFWETHGQSDDPLDPDLTADYRKQHSMLFPSWGQIPVDWRVTKMREYLQEAGPLPVVIYGHCDCGCDRTGEMFGSYALKYLNYTWEQTSMTDGEIAGRNISCSEYRGMMWYCFSLKYNFPVQHGWLDCETTYQPNCHTSSSAYEKELKSFPRTMHLSREEDPLPQSSSVKNVYYVDSRPMLNNSYLENWLFRGGDPDTLSGYNFNYDGVVSAMKNAAKAVGKTLPSKFTMIEITTLGIHTGHDVFRAQNENAYFAENPDKGSFVHWQVYGESDDPFLFERDSDRFTYMLQHYKRWSHDLLIDRVQHLQELLAHQGNLPVVIFAHDREGYHEVAPLVSAYSLQALGSSFTEVSKLNEQISGSSSGIPCYYYFSTQWYCYYLMKNVGGAYSTLDCAQKVQSSCYSST